jgi:Ca2+-binding EF-hand superfamily protein
MMASARASAAKPLAAEVRPAVPARPAATPTHVPRPFTDPTLRRDFLEESIRRRVEVLAKGRMDVLGLKRTLTALFKPLDSDKSGWLGSGDFRRALSAFGLFGVDAEELFNAHCYAGDDAVNYEDFAAVLYGEKKRTDAALKAKRRPCEPGGPPLNMEALVASVRESFRARGAAGIHGIGRKFRIVDDNGSGWIDLEEFRKVLAEHGLGLSAREVRALFGFFDADADGRITFNEFLRGLRNAMNDRRKALIAMAFRAVDKDGNGILELADIKAAYDASRHPEVLAGRRSAESVLLEFLNGFDGGNKDGIVTPAEFEAYYADVSASIDSDDYFELMMRNAWCVGFWWGLVVVASRSSRHLIPPDPPPPPLHLSRQAH